MTKAFASASLKSARRCSVSLSAAPGSPVDAACCACCAPPRRPRQASTKASSRRFMRGRYAARWLDMISVCVGMLKNCVGTPPARACASLGPMKVVSLVLLGSLVACKPDPTPKPAADANRRGPHFDDPKALDTNNDGEISPDELQAGIRELRMQRRGQMMRGSE